MPRSCSGPQNDFLVLEDGQRLQRIEIRYAFTEPVGSRKSVVAVVFFGRICEVFSDFTK